MKPFSPRLLTAFPQLRGPLIGLTVLGVLGGAATIAQALTLGWLLTALVTSHPLNGPLVGVCVAFTTRAVCAGLSEYTASLAAGTASTSLRRALLEASLGRGTVGTPQESSDLEHPPAPSPLANPTLVLQGATSVEPYFARYLPTLLTACLVPVAVVVCMAILDPLTALIPLLTLPLLPLFAALIGLATKDATATRWRALASLSGHFLDVMKGLPTLVNYGRAERQTSAIATTSARHRDATVATLKLAFLSSAALELLATISVAIVAVAVGIRLASGSMPLWPALPLILLAPEAYWPIRRVGAEFHNAADGAAALEAALPVIAAHQLGARHTPVNHAPETDAGAKGVDAGNAVAIVGTTTNVEPSTNLSADTSVAPRNESAAPLPHRPRLVAMVSDLSYRYNPCGPWVFDHFSHAFTTGLNIISGPSGVGKTTLLELLAGIRQPEKGRVEAPATHTLTQRPFLLPGTIEDNLTLGIRSPHPDHLNEALVAVDLAETVAQLPLGLKTPLGEDGFGLSAGQRARLTVARALLSDAPLLLCDEPTAHLDPSSVKAVVNALSVVSQSRAVVIVTHQPDVLPPAATHLTLTAALAPAAMTGGEPR